MGKCRRLAFVVLAVLLGPALSGARAAPGQDLEDPRGLAAAFLQRQESDGTDGALAWLRKEGRDPWIAVEGLLLAGRKEEARRVAEAGLSSDAPQLVAYVQREEAQSAALADAVDEAEALLGAGKAEEALARLGPRRSVPRTVTEVRLQLARARAMRALEREEEAVQALEDTVTGTAAAMGWRRGEIAASLAILEHIPGLEQPELQRRVLRRLVDIDRDVHDLGRAATWCLQLGRLEERFDRPQQACTWLLEAAGLFDSLADSPRLTPDLANERLRCTAKLADVQLDVGETAEGLDNALSAYRERSGAQPDVQVMILAILAKAYQVFGRPDMARDMLKDAVDLARTETPDWYPLLLGQQAQLLVNLGDIAGALERYKEVGEFDLSPTLEYIRRLNVAFAQLADHRAEGSDRRLNVVYEDMLTLFSDLRKEPPDLPRRSEIEISANYYIGEVLDRLDRSPEAERYLLDALDAPYAREAPSWQQGARLLLARCYRHQHKPRAALQALHKALDALEAEVGVLPASWAFSQLTRSRNRELVEECMASARDLGTPEDLLWALETTRGMLYLKEAQRRREGGDVAVSAADAVPGAGLRREVAEAARAYWEADAVGLSSGVEAASKKLAEARDRLRAEEERVTLAAAVEDAEKGPPSPGADSPFRRKKAALEQDEAFLYYEPCGDDVLVCAVFRDRLGAFPIGKRDAVGESVEKARTAWHDGDSGSAYMSLSKGLAETLLPPGLRAHLGFGAEQEAPRPAHLYVSAGGTLAALPWTLLLEQVLKDPPTVSFVSSQKVLRTIRTWNPKPTGDALLALGDPDYTVTTHTESRDFRFDRDLPRLEGSRRTVEAIVRPGTDDVGLLGTEASVRLLTEGLTHAAYPFDHLHLGCHGHLHQASPWLSGLALHAEDDDGLLSVEEVSAWRMQSPPRLVVLAACESGLGTPVPCEGEDGLVRAFQLAGARHVVASLWSADDKSSSDLMIAFYRHLRQEGLSPVDALRAAQHDVRDANEGKTAHPYYWAGWAVWGPRD